MRIFILIISIASLWPLYVRTISDFVISESSYMKTYAQKIEHLFNAHTLEGRYYLARYMILDGMTSKDRPKEERSRIVYHACTALDEMRRYAPGYKKMEKVVDMLTVTTARADDKVGIIFDGDTLVWPVRQEMYWRRMIE